MITVILSLGANLGEREETIRHAVAQLQPVAVSALYYTPPWGDTEQPDYVNATAVVRRDGWGTAEWFAHTRELEQQAGRVRDPQRRYGPRSLDIDLIAAWDGETAIFSDDPELTLPHPRAQQRAFVLQPWLEIQPDAELPGHGPLTELLQRPELDSDRAAIRRGPEVGPHHHD
ncbi:2-amino-4-hydroxy-6-hydroxymethyldihydropteridine diphosphokinase [Haloglycomyces albus]|uniref:2-amino-4-hydroxy-6- hydroxymethyldihydropteridine diphosphokinase n=1 Tax=Haloglycomyces albus TaxID=526067 RepID=UPI00046D480D|nr:2-amino-4-hydroxy-6-hydroxymethyldihydropteridine diphosphokinase [Haloglycomyces albus]